MAAARGGAPGGTRPHTTGHLAAQRGGTHADDSSGDPAHGTVDRHRRRVDRSAADESARARGRGGCLRRVVCGAASLHRRQRHHRACCQQPAVRLCGPARAPSSPGGVCKAALHGPACWPRGSAAIGAAQAPGSGCRTSRPACCRTPAARPGSPRQPAVLGRGGVRNISPLSMIIICCLDLLRSSPPTHPITHPTTTSTKVRSGCSRA